MRPTNRSSILALAALALCAFAGTLTGCGGSSSASMSSASSGSTGSADVSGLPAVNHKSATGSSSGAGGAVLAPDRGLEMPKLPTEVIRTATLSLGIARGVHLDQQSTRAAAIADNAGGWIESSTVQSSGSRYAQMVIRVPARSFETVLAQLQGLGHVRSTSQHGQDVTRQLVDIDSRLTNLQAQRQVLLRLMNRARTIDASIKVENELAGVQGQIEQLQGEQRYLGDQAAMSTITVTMSLPAAPPPAQPGHPNTLVRALRRSVDAAEAVVTAVIVAAGFLLPIALILGLAAVAARRVWPALLRRTDVQMPDKG